MRTLAAGLVAALTMGAAGAAAAQPRDLAADVAGLVQPTAEARRAAVAELLRARNLPFEEEAFTGGARGGPDLEGRNLIVTLGEGPRDLLLTAHYDVVALPDGRLVQGVVDNGASVAILAEAARRLADGPPLRHRVRVIFFDQEELGLIGAERYLERHGAERVAAVVNSDVAAFGDALMHSEPADPAFAPVLRALRETCAAEALTCVGFPNYPPSDDRVFAAAGVPTVSIGFQDRAGVHQLWLALNARGAGLAPGFTPEIFGLLHSGADTLERLDPATLERAASAYVEIIRRLDAALPVS